MAGWELIGGDPAPGDPSAISSLAVEFGTTADNARDVRDRLVRLKDGATDAIWRGDTADAFRDRIDKMPEHLEKLDRSYRKASQGLDAYARELRDLKADAEAALTKAGSAKQDAQTARSNQASFNESNTDPAVSNPHDEAVSGADQRLQQAIGDANDVRGRKRSAEDRAIASLDEASDLGIKNDPWWRKALRQLSTALKIIGLVLLVIAIVVIVVIALATPGGFLAILAAIQACAFLGTLGTAMTVVGVAAFATAATQYATGDETVGLGDVALAGVFAFGPMALGRGLNYLRGARGAVQAGDDLVRAGSGGTGGGAAPKVGRPDGATVISGHGSYKPVNQLTTVPEGTTPVVYAPHGASISDRLGNAIETGTKQSRIPFTERYQPGDFIPDYTVHPPKGLNIEGNPITVTKDTPLSDLLKPNMGDVHLAFCLWEKGHPNANTVIRLLPPVAPPAP